MSDRESGNEVTIAFFTDAPYVGGAERYLTLLARGIRAHGYGSLLITAGEGNLEPLKEAMRGEGAGVHDLGRGSVTGAGFARRLLGILRRVRPSLFHFNLPGPFDARYSLAAPVAWMAGIRNIVSTEHLPMVRSFPKGRILKSLSTRFVSRVITVSDDNRGHLIRNHHTPASKIRVVHNGIPASESLIDLDLRSDLGIEGDSLLIAIVGALEERKEHATLLEAMARLPVSVHALIVGEGEMEGELRGTVSALGISDRVHFTGYRNDVPSIMRDIDMLVVPSSIEATPYVILEAMEAGLPVIASSVFGIPELVVAGETGLLVPPRDVDTLAAALRSLCSDPERRRLMGNNALERYRERFTMERCVLGTLEVYRELIRG